MFASERCSCCALGGKMSELVGEGAAAEVLNFVEHFNAEENEADILLGQTVEHMRGAGPWFDRHDGADHVFLFSWGRFPCRLANWRLHLRSAIALQVEDHCEDLNSESPQPTFSRWKDIIIPGHIDQWRVLELRRRNKPFERRERACLRVRAGGLLQSIG